MSSREAYPNPPLRLVSLEFRYPLTSKILSRTVWDAFENELGAMLPIVEVDDETNPDDQLPRHPYDLALRRLTATRSRAVTLYHGAVTVEVGDYDTFRDLQDLTAATLRAVESIPGGLPISHASLRYINEMPAATFLSERAPWQRLKSWKPFVNGELLHGIRRDPPSLCSYGHQGRVLMHSDADEPVYLSLDYGAHPQGRVEPEGVLTLTHKPGPCFLVDIDAFVVGTPSTPLGTGVATMMPVLDALHTAVENAFDWSVTDAAREVFRGSVDDNAGLRAVGA